MKLFKILTKTLLLGVCLLQFVACGKDRWPEYATQTAQDEWIDSVMREQYLWNDEIPESKKLNYFTTPTTFLKTLFGTADNSYSHVDTLLASPLLSYGMTYKLYADKTIDTLYNALITDIIPGSPASEAGLQRGDWIMKANGVRLNASNRNILLSTGTALTLTMGKFVAGTDTTTTTDYQIKEGSDVQLGAQRAVEDDPIHYHTVLTSTTGEKIGYLVYNSFKSGTTAEPQKYDNELRSISNEFAAAGVTYFILDLRYNTGGEYNSAQLLGSLLAPTLSLGNAFAQLTYNSRQTARNRTLLYSKEIIGSGSNLNIQTGLILTSSETSPRIAGLLLNCLAPLKRWGLIGTSLACPGVACEAFTDIRYPWTLYPVVCSFANSEGNTNIGGTYKANYTASETDDLATFLPFGNKGEGLLNVAIQVINGTYKGSTSAIRR